LFELFHTADEKYNSGLFDFKEDRITRELIIDNKVLKVIIGELYYPKCEYEFSVMPADILGSVYERFLGKTIRLTVGHQAKVEEKPEVRKAGGVYYTPKYIVDYIVENTVGKLLEGKTPKDAEKLRICDPACGSGSFLIGAYQYLLDWHLRYNLTPGPSPGRRGEKNRALTPDGHLTTALKKRILLNNIYGVDIDPQAVEVTKLNLLLKALEGETQASINQQMTLFHERVLPNLSHNIQCGNSLIGPDFYDNQFDLFPDQMKKINAFDWQRAFPEVFTGGGFDCVIGNPPYGALFQNADITYLKSIYQTAVWRVESYLMFIEKGINLLTRSGLLGYIIPDTLTNLGFTRPVRQMLLKKSNLKEIVGLPSNVFNQATVDTIILITEKDLPSEEFNSSIVLVKLFKKKQTITSIENPQLEFSINTKEWYDQDSFNIKSDEQVIRLIKKISENRIQIKEIGAIYYGIKVYQTGKGNPPQTDQVKLNKPYTSDKQISSSWLPFFDGKHIGRYKIFWDNNNWINYGTWLAEPRPPKIFEGEKILIRKIIGKTIIATHTQSTSYCNTLLFILKITNSEFSYKCILAILNSLLIGWYFRKKFQISDDDTFPQIMIRDILQIPIPQIDERKSKELTKFVEELLSLNHAVMKVKLDIDIKIIQSKISYCEDRINSLVYELYGLTEEEREIVEGK
jgi:type I restriction-modification system DNA methylase subunit